MGYNTYFDGELTINNLPKNFEALDFFDQFLGADCRDYPEWGGWYISDNNIRCELTHINLVWCKQDSTICWNGSEKTYDMDKILNLITKVTRKLYPGFYFSGELFGRGDAPRDIYFIRFDKEGLAYKVNIFDELKSCGVK